MSINIHIGLTGKSPGESARVVGGSPSMSTLVYPVADIIEEKYPEIYAKAFESLAWGEVYLDELDSKEFMIVYEITKKVFLEREPGSITTIGARGENWNEYMEKLEQDPRYNKTI